MKSENEQPTEEKANVVIHLSVIDRFEGEFAVLAIGDNEEEETIDIPRSDLPKGSKAGDHLRVQIENGQLISAAIDEAETENTKLRIQDKLARLRRGEHIKG